MLFQSDDHVRVVQRPTTPKEHCEEGREGRFVEYTSHGFARVRFLPEPEWKDRSWDVWLIHPENLQRIVDCAVEDCGFYANDMSDYCATGKTKKWSNR